jgi:RNA polymerase sigma-70 factor (ECF subfamily)
MDDQQLIRGIKENDENAFREFVDKYQQMVTNVANSFLHNYDDSLDIAQEVFIKVYDTIDKFREESRISTWLYRITVNKSLNFIRDRKRKNIFSSLDLLFEKSQKNPADTVPDETNTKEEEIEHEENKKVLLEAIDELPKKQKVAITLNKLEEVPYKEVAEIMGISVSETGVLINRAKNKIEKKLFQYFQKR